jgi:hypothetical protein
MEPNPYQSPSAAAVPDESPEQRALAKLRGPSLGLIALSGMTILPCAVVSLFGPVVILLKLAIVPRLVQAEEVLPTIGSFLMLFPNSVVLYGAWQARTLKNYRWALASAICGSVPLLSPYIYCGIPFGIWILIVLLRKDVKACFEAHHPPARDATA